MVRKQLSPTSVSKLLNLTVDDITLDELKRMFAALDEGEPAIPPTGEFIVDLDKTILAPMSSPSKSRRFTTTAGRYIANLFLFGGFSSVMQNMAYINEPFNKGIVGKIDGMMAEFLLDETITSAQFQEFIDREQWLGFAPTAFIAPSFEYDSLAPIDKVMKRKKELEKQYAKELAANDVETILKVENELIALAKEELDKKNSGGFDVYNSGASGSFGNNYKNVSVMRGAIPKSNDLSDYTYSGSNLSDGIQDDETAPYADMMVLASFSRAVGTQSGGYIVKQINAAFQHITLDEEGTDCKTKYYTKAKITEKNSKDYFLNYMVDRKGQLVLLDRETLKSVIGKTVTLRSPRYCKTPKICSKCAGELFYRMGIRNIGLLLNRIGSNVLNASLKKFHDLTIRTTEIDIIGNMKEIK